jgi:predicted DNA-binding transcriptional regulator AlpA
MFTETPAAVPSDDKSKTRLNLNLEEAAIYCRIGPSLLRTQLRNGTGPRRIKIGRRVVFRCVDLDEWLETLVQ